MVYSSGIPPEMVKVCSSDLLECLVKLFTCVWDSKSIPQYLKDTLLILVSRMVICHSVTNGVASVLWK